MIDAIKTISENLKTIEAELNGHPRTEKPDYEKVRESCKTIEKVCHITRLTCDLEEKQP